MGHLLESFVKAFKPRLVFGIEPSDFVFQKAVKRLRRECRRVKSVKNGFVFRHCDLVSWCREPLENGTPVYDLALCTSVFQYLSDDEIRFFNL